MLLLSNLCKFHCHRYGDLRVVARTLNDGHDFVSFANTDGDGIDALLFFDSRGISRKYEGSLAQLLCKHLDAKGQSYVLVCRPLELTIWATLIGFCRNNSIRPKRIVTNMGFVDFTPKKLSKLSDARWQSEVVLNKGVATASKLEIYETTGGPVALYGMQYNNTYRSEIENIATKHELVIVNTPLTSSDINIERGRPSSFFEMQRKSNDFNRSISGAKVIDFPNFSEAQTYDAVHYTQKGNQTIFDILRKAL